MKVILIPGLGYDCRIFDKLNFGNYEVVQLSWIEPKSKEPIREYALRMFEDVQNRNEKHIIIGHSMGGIIAQEIASQYEIAKIILLSSIKSRDELPFHFKIVAPFRLQHIFTKELSLKSINYWGKGHGFENEESIELFKSMVGGQSNVYLSWALRALSQWKGIESDLSADLFQIHGTRDKTFPYKLIKKPDLSVENGSHILMYNKPAEINKIILNEITWTS